MRSHFATNLDLIAGSLRISGNEIARRCGVAGMTISRIRRGQCAPATDTAMAVSRWCGVECGAMLSRRLSRDELIGIVEKHG